ncbi:MAG: CPBP family intramembrane metalloprotease [Oscillatoria princeps RMCB-10]|jgi:membrane protease YdiL (CAAX protease family)|nr:CPBP family intramembrane metalloprotease [Oscillatoria princeps RMCB-10]
MLMAYFDLVTSLEWLAHTPAFVKVIAFFFTWAALWLPLAIPLAIALKWQPLKPLPAGQKLAFLASLYPIAPMLVWGFARWENLPLSHYGLAWHPDLLVSLGRGTGLAILSLAVMFGLFLRLGWIKWLPASANTPLASVLLSTLLAGLWVGGTEELVFRGFLLSELQQDCPVPVAAVISSLIFALLHLVWDVRDTLPQLPGLWLMGMVLVLARAVDGGSLGLAWGLHAGWIWVIASLDTAGAIAYTGTAPEWLTGVGGKPLAGAAGTLMLLATGALLWGLGFLSLPA